MLKIFYDERQQVNNNSSFSPSAGKPAKVLANWKAHGLPLSVEAVTPLNRAEIALAHDPQYVRDVLSLKRPNGFGNTLKEVAKSLHWTTGSITSAAKYAVQNKSQAISLTSGFHHACYSSGGGFCTLNGLVIAAQMLKLHGYVNRVGILDLDMHYGNGTDDIIKKLKLDYIGHYTIGGKMWSHHTIENFLSQLPSIFDELFAGVDLLIYQAGADSCIDDPLGGVFSQEQMRRRDRIVFQECKKRGIPVVWNLAGGYQDRFENVLAIHRATAEEHLSVFNDQKFDTGCESDYVKPEKVVYQIDDHDDDFGLSDEIDWTAQNWDEEEEKESSWADDVNWDAEMSEELSRFMK
jgi:acetoin utilization deacetylase AcuC-like enzyme